MPGPSSGWARTWATGSATSARAVAALARSRGASRRCTRPTRSAAPTTRARTSTSSSSSTPTVDARASCSSVCRAPRGRGRSGARGRWGPRTLDVDVLWVDGDTVSTSPTWRCRTRACGSGGSCWPPRRPGSRPRHAGAAGRRRRARCASSVRSTTCPPTRRSTDDARPDHRARAGRRVARHRALARRVGGAAARSGATTTCASAAAGTDLLVIATPDARHRRGRRTPSTPVERTVVAHLSGSLGLHPLAGHRRRAVLHPLVALPDAERGAERLVGAWFGLAEDGDPLVAEVVASLGGPGRARRRDRLGPLPRRRGHRLEPPRRAARPGRAGRGQRRRARSRPSSTWRGAASTTSPPSGPAARSPARSGAATPPRSSATSPPCPPDERAAYEAHGRRGRASCAADHRHDHRRAPRRASTPRAPAGRRSGFVPTMGYLHDGHASLMAAARAGTDVVVASIFVNPLQFAPTEDLDAYPRDLDGDTALAEREGVDLLFVPSGEEMYPDGAVRTTVTVAEVSRAARGPRPAHPLRRRRHRRRQAVRHRRARAAAYFGEKDFQQLAVVRRMVATSRSPSRSWPARPSASPTGWPCRAATPTSRPRSGRPRPVVHASPAGGPRRHRRRRARPGQGAGPRWPTSSTPSPSPSSTTPRWSTPRTLQVVDPLAGELRLLAAVRFGKARLIDNLGAPTPPEVDSATAVATADWNRTSRGRPHGGVHHKGATRCVVA